jgi:hypothetical protein
MIYSLFQQGVIPAPDKDIRGQAPARIHTPTVIPAQAGILHHHVIPAKAGIQGLKDMDSGSSPE